MRGGPPFGERQQIVRIQLDLRYFVLHEDSSAASLTRMSQVKDRLVTAEAMVRSRAWREGYASCCRGEGAEFMERGTKALSYEYGRLTAAYLKGEGQPVPWVSERRPLPDRLTPYFARALMECAKCRAGADHEEIEEPTHGQGRRLS